MEIDDSVPSDDIRIKFPIELGNKKSFCILDNIVRI